jgi:hypothetical protein
MAPFTLTPGPTYVLFLFMIEGDEDRAERHGRILKALAECNLRAVQKLTDQLEDAKTDIEHERYALGLHRMSRDLRLTLALEERLVHERHKAFREERVDRQKAVEHRKKQVDHAVTERLYAEREGEDAEALLEKLDELLDEHRLYEAFLDRPLEAVIARLCKTLGLVPPPQGEGDREAVEGVETHSDLRGLQPPHPASPGAPPEGEQLAPPPQARAGPS